MGKRAYPSDLTDEAWAIVAPLVPQSKRAGRPITISRRALLNAIFYVTKTGCGWEWLPREFPRWKTVYHYCRLWQRAGVGHAIHTALRTALRQATGRNAQPSAAIIASQSVKTTSVGGPRGYDGAKNIKGRKRHLLVDTQGFVLTVKVHNADIADRDGARLVLDGMTTNFPRVTKLWVDSGDNGRFRTWAADNLSWNIELVKHWWNGSRGRIVMPDVEPLPLPSGFHVLPRRWVVARTFAWLGHHRRLSQDYERLPSTSETFVYTAMSRLMVRRLARQQALQRE